MIRTLTVDDCDAAVRLINDAARWYAEFLPLEEVPEPEMTSEQGRAEADRMTWYGAFDAADLVGVVGHQYVDDVALLRHWYVDPAHQRRGTGSRLREHLERQVTGVRRIVAGTYIGNITARRALEQAGYRLSARSHGNLLDVATAELMAANDAFLVPTLVAYDKVHELGEELGMPADQRRKVADVIDQGLGSLTIAREAGVKVGFGSELLGAAQEHQAHELRIRAKVEDPIDLLRSATLVNAELFGMTGQVGTLASGAHADLLIVDGEPMDDPGVLADRDRLALVMRGGKVVVGR